MKKLLLGIALILCAAGCGLGAYLSSRKMLSQSVAQSQLVEQVLEIARVNQGTQQRVIRLFPFEWERLCVFNWFDKLSIVNPALGVDWVTPSEETIATAYGGYTMPDFQVVVFVHSGKVVQHLVFPEYPFRTSSGGIIGGECFQNRPDLVIEIGTSAFYFPQNQ